MYDTHWGEIPWYMIHTWREAGQQAPTPPIHSYGGCARIPFAYILLGGNWPCYYTMSHQLFQCCVNTWNTWMAKLMIVFFLKIQYVSTVAIGWNTLSLWQLVYCLLSSLFSCISCLFVFSVTTAQPSLSPPVSPSCWLLADYTHLPSIKCTIIQYMSVYSPGLFSQLSQDACLFSHSSSSRLSLCLLCGSISVTFAKNLFTNCCFPCTSWSFSPPQWLTVWSPSGSQITPPIHHPASAST